MKNLVGKIDLRWQDPSKPKVEEVQTIENSKLMEVRVLPPKEFLQRMEVVEDEDQQPPNRQGLNVLNLLNIYWV